MHLTELLTPVQAGRISGRDPRTIRKWVVTNAVPNLGVEIGGRVFVRRWALSRLLEGPTQPTQENDGLTGESVG